jgi:hypothetical protein
VKLLLGDLKMSPRKLRRIEVKTDNGEDRRQKEAQNEPRAVTRS